MKLTGERMIPEHEKGKRVYLEHIARYNFAQQFIKSKKVLDAGSGSGYGSNNLAENGAKSVLGLDISEEAVNYSRGKYKRDNLSYQVQDLSKLDFEKGDFDTVISFELIEHLKKEDQEKFISAVAKILDQKGVFIISTPNVRVYPKGNHFHIHEMTEREFLTLLSNNFKNVKVFYQDDIETSYIVEENYFRNIKKVLPDPDLRPIEDIDVHSSQYFIAVCSNKSLDKSTSSFSLSSNKPWQEVVGKSKEAHSVVTELKNNIKDLTVGLKNKDEEIKVKNHEIMLRESELIRIKEENQAIKKTRTWKFRNSIAKRIGKKVV